MTTTMREGETADTPQARYVPADIEPKWHKRWDESGLYRTEDHSDGKDNWFALTMFPYPSGDLHIGHWFAFTGGDIGARFKRMQGYNVMHPQGFDAFGLPAENAAISHNIHPRQWTYDRIANLRRQFHLMGNSYDWSRQVITCDPEYYHWNQYFFLKMFESGLAYRAEGAANWCPQDQTTLANEQVKDGSCERCGAQVERREMPQWFFRITKYADELLNMEDIDWPEKIRVMQRNWIGRSEGVTVAFDAGEFAPGEKIETFTTRIDTIYGVTFVVLAPEHRLVDVLTQPGQRAAVDEYVAQARRESEIERTSTDRDKTGVPTGAYCTNPLNGERVPVLVGDYVLATYGSGAVMGVPAHDVRDFDFAKKYGLPIRVVVAPDNWQGEELTGSLGRSGYADQLRRVRRTAEFRGDGPESPTRSRRMDGAVARSRTTCETGSSRASVTGVRPYPSSTVRSAAPSRFRKMNCPFSCPKMPTSNRQDSHLSHSTPISSPRPARSAERKRGGRRTRWTRSWTRRGITCATRALHSTAGRSTPKCEVVVAGASVHRGHGARGDAPAVRPFLHQGPAGHGLCRFR